MKIYSYTLTVPVYGENILVEQIHEADDFVRTQTGWDSASLEMQVSRGVEVVTDEDTSDLILKTRSESPIEDAEKFLLESYEMIKLAEDVDNDLYGGEMV